MKVPEHLAKPLLEQLEDQETSEDCLVIRGSALGYAILDNIDKRDESINKFLETPEPELLGNQLARELQARAVGKILLDKSADGLLKRSKEIFETELEKALPDLPEDLAIDVATEPLRNARQARSGLMENAFLAKEWALCMSEGEQGRSIIPDYLLYQPHREGYPIEFVAKGIHTEDMEMAIKGVEMQDEFLNYVIEVGYLKPWEEAYFTSYAISLISRKLLD